MRLIISGDIVSIDAMGHDGARRNELEKLAELLQNGKQLQLEEVTRECPEVAHSKTEECTNPLHSCLTINFKLK